jgi:hypothetical protein
MERETLVVRGGLEGVENDGDGYSLIFDSEEVHVDAVVNAATTGGIKREKIPLAQRLIAEGIGTANRSGGISTDGRTQRLIGPDGRLEEDLYAVGILSDGWEQGQIEFSDGIARLTQAAARVAAGTIERARLAA